MYHAAHALLLHTVTHRPTNKRYVYRRPVKEAKYNGTSSINTDLITSLAIERDHITTIDLKLDWQDVRAVISLLSLQS